MRGLLLGLLLAHGADAATTDIAFARGGREVVAPSQQPAVLNLIDAGEGAFEYAFIRKLETRHPKVARWLLAGALAGQGYAVAHNVKELRR